MGTIIDLTLCWKNTHLEVYQFIAPLLAMYYIVRLVIEFQKRKKFLFTNIIWLVFWIVIGILGIVPHELSTGIAKWLGFADNINAIIFIVLAFVIILTFYLSGKIDNLERKITELVRQLALDESKIRELERKRLTKQKKREKSLLEEI